MTDQNCALLQKHQANISRLAQAFGLTQSIDSDRKSLSSLLDIPTPFDLAKLRSPKPLDESIAYTEQSSALK
jgi:hypothetical protein